MRRYSTSTVLYCTVMQFVSNRYILVPTVKSNEIRNKKSYTDRSIVINE